MRLEFFQPDFFEDKIVSSFYFERKGIKDAKGGSSNASQLVIFSPAVLIEVVVDAIF